MGTATSPFLLKHRVGCMECTRYSFYDLMANALFLRNRLRRITTEDRQMKQTIRRLGRLACFMWLCFGIAGGALAATGDIGMVMNVEGDLSAKGADGALRKLGVFGKVLVGDILFTGKDSYARVKFSDGGQISL